MNYGKFLNYVEPGTIYAQFYSLERNKTAGFIFFYYPGRGGGGGGGGG